MNSKSYPENENESRFNSYTLQLYVNGANHTSTRAIRNLKKICDEYLEEKYNLEVIDINQHPNLISKEQIIATPTLVKKLPAPIRVMIGDLSNLDHVLVGLNLTKE